MRDIIKRAESLMTKEPAEATGGPRLPCLGGASTLFASQVSAKPSMHGYPLKGMLVRSGMHDTAQLFAQLSHFDRTWHRPFLSLHKTLG